MEKIFPFNSLEAKLLQLLYFLKKIKISDWPSITYRGFLPYEKWFLNQYFDFFKNLNVTSVIKCLHRLKLMGLVKENPGHTFYLTSDGVLWAYNIIEYIKQIQLNELLNFFTKFKNILSVNKISDCVKILDIGCGGGASLIAMDKIRILGKNKLLFGLDIDFKTLSFAKRSIELFYDNKHIYNKIILIKGNAIKLPFRNESFHILYSKETLYLLNRNLFINEAYRVLLPKGKLIIITPSYKYFIKVAFKLLKQRRLLSIAKQFFALINGISLYFLKKQYSIKGMSLYAETVGSLASALKNAGFNILYCNYYKGRFSISPIVAIAEKM